MVRSRPGNVRGGRARAPHLGSDRRAERACASARGPAAGPARPSLRLARPPPERGPGPAARPRGPAPTSARCHSASAGRAMPSPPPPGGPRPRAPRAAARCRGCWRAGPRRAEPPPRVAQASAGRAPRCPPPLAARGRGGGRHAPRSHRHVAARAPFRGLTESPPPLPPPAPRLLPSRSFATRPRGSRVTAANSYGLRPLARCARGSRALPPPSRRSALRFVEPRNGGAGGPAPLCCGEAGGGTGRALGGAGSHAAVPPHSEVPVPSGRLGGIY